jgi:hypothetical protein
LKLSHSNSYNITGKSFELTAVRPESAAWSRTKSFELTAVRPESAAWSRTTPLCNTKVKAELFNTMAIAEHLLTY